MKSSLNSQTARLEKLFRDNPNVEFNSPTLQDVASNGSYVNSFSKRISELRDRGLNIVKTRDEHFNGQRQTGYTNVVQGVKVTGLTIPENSGVVKLTLSTHQETTL